MVILSVQISVNLYSVLKGWGIHPLDELATLAEVLEQFKRGEIEGCSSFVFPDSHPEQLNRSKFVWAVSAVSEWGRYMRLVGVITPSDQPSFADGGGQEKPFRMMMDAQLALRVPEKVKAEAEIHTLTLVFYC